MKSDISLRLEHFFNEYTKFTKNGGQSYITLKSRMFSKAEFTNNEGTFRRLKQQKPNTPPPAEGLPATFFLCTTQSGVNRATHLFDFYFTVYSSIAIEFMASLCCRRPEITCLVTFHPPKRGHHLHLQIKSSKCLKLRNRL